MKKLFTNYNFEFDKNEKKLISSFCKQALKQMGSDNQYFAEEKAFNSIIEKLNGNAEIVKLTKDEKIRLTHQHKTECRLPEKADGQKLVSEKMVDKSLYNQYEIFMIIILKDKRW